MCVCMHVTQYVMSQYCHLYLLIQFTLKNCTKSSLVVCLKRSISTLSDTMRYTYIHKCIKKAAAETSVGKYCVETHMCNISYEPM